MKFFNILLLFIKTNAFASSISLDVGQTQAIFNRFAIPNTAEDRISLPTDDVLTSYRVTSFVDLSSGNQLYFLLAPLETDYSFTSNSAFEFSDVLFNSNEETKIKYKFNSYRVGYLWKWKGSTFDFWTGLVGKIRDAKIEVTQGSSNSSFDNIGFVPLASLGFEWRLLSSLSLYSHTDALGASQGSAYDSQLDMKWKLGPFVLSFGKRILGGGADNDNVYNFAQFDSTYTRFTYNY